MVDILTGSGLSQTGRSTAPDPSLDRVSVGGSGNFTTPNSVVFEFGTVNQQQKFGTPRAVYVDNGTGPNPIIVHSSITEQTFTIPPFAQGYFAITSTEVSRITFSGDGGNTDKVNIQIYNYEIPPQVWYAPGQNNPVAANAVQGSMAEGSSVAAASSKDPVYIGGIDRNTGLFHGVSVNATGELQIEAVIDTSTPLDVVVTNPVTIDSSTPVNIDAPNPLDVVVTNPDALQGAYTDISIASLSGASEPLAAANAARRVICISNPNAVNPIGVNLTGAAAALGTAGTFTILAGESLVIDNFPPNNAINVIGTAADVVTGYEG